MNKQSILEDSFPYYINLFQLMQDSVSSVESLQQKHMQFEKDLKAHLKKIDKMAFFAQKLKDSQHYDSENIMTKCQAVLRRYHSFFSPVSSYMV